MQTLILIGPGKSKQEYLEKFKTENNVYDYLIVSDTPFRISDARLLQKAISLKLGENEKRLITIQDPTLEAQNAILKTIEEFPAGNTVFFLASSKEEFLPTIQSRCFLLKLEQEKIISDSQLEQKIFEITKDKSQQKIFEVIDSLSPLELSDIEKLILSLRSALVASINDRTASTELLHKVLKNLSKNYGLVKSNNINKRAAVENAFLD